MAEVKKWRVLSAPYRLPDGRWLATGAIFEATEEELGNQRSKVEEVIEPEAKEEKEEDNKEKPKRRGRPPKQVEAFGEAPEDRSL